jgi:hypothetical protein
MEKCYTKLLSLEKGFSAMLLTCGLEQERGHKGKCRQAIADGVIIMWDPPTTNERFPL